MPEGTENAKSVFLVAEILKIEEKLHDFRTFYDLLDATEQRLEKFKSCLREAGTLSDGTRTELSAYSTELKSMLADLVKAHRDVHPPISKFGKFIEKNCVEDISNMTSYFLERVAQKERPPYNESSKPADGLGKTNEESLGLVIIEHLLRHGRDSLATSLVQDFGFNASDVELEAFRGLSNLISTIQRGDIDFARKWLSEHKEQLGSRADELQYTLVKLDFLSAVRQQSDDPAAILRCARQLVPFAQTYAADFEHLMGSLVFLGRSLERTPYEDLSFVLTPTGQANPLPEDRVTGMEQNSSHNDITVSSGDELDRSSTQFTRNRSSGDALTDAANLFRSCYCHQLNLSDVDPLCTVFASGCKLLSRQQNLQRAISCLTKYSNADCDTLPIAVELDPVAHRHNIFHCPVMKEVITTSNGPVRLSCGHAISRDAFESLPNSDRRSYGLGQSSGKVKCPYCPMETYKNQALDLIF